MNLKAIVIIIARVSTGTFILLRGDRSLEIPSVNVVGEVVYVRSELTRIRQIILIAMKIAVNIPPVVILSFHHSRRTVPLSL